ncbi:MAG: beta-galactosidase [Christensenellales bacterium]|jgi:beta-galactosidase
MDLLRFGVAYYHEYLPYERLAQDVAMMKEAHINTVRIAESTWSTLEPHDGEFDFRHIDPVLDAMEEAGIDVIVGTPTYALPPWLALKCPSVLAVTSRGPGRYGARQIMDITDESYLFHAERVIRKLISHVAGRKCVVGYQLDNETKYYDTTGPNVQRRFVAYLKKQFPDIEELNRVFGLDYWSNRINAWEDFPDVTASINGSLTAEFDKFRRTLVDSFLAWQADIVREYAREDQFITHNFDFEWRGHSYGVQPAVNHFHAAKCLTFAAVDIYHPSQDVLTGAEIAFGGDMTRSLKQDNYLVLETQAQAFAHWLPYPGQLRLQGFSHLASGANGVNYWHWHSIHNSFETYWKGLLSHDFEKNPTYLEAATLGADMERLSEKLVNLKKKNRAAVLVSNEALTALQKFPFLPPSGSPFFQSADYNNVVRWVYDALYRMNLECDFLCPDDASRLGDYAFVAVPALYSAPDSLLAALRDYVKKGGHLLATFKTGFTNEYVKVAHDRQPHILGEALGITYSQFTVPGNAMMRSEELALPENAPALHFLELVTPTTARVLAEVEHPFRKGYAAITENAFGKGKAVYIAAMSTDEVMERLLEHILKDAGLWGAEQSLYFPLITRGGVNRQGRDVHYCFNYSGRPVSFPNLWGGATELISGSAVAAGETLTLPEWGVAILEIL